MIINRFLIYLFNKKKYSQKNRAQILNKMSKRIINRLVIVPYQGIKLVRSTSDQFSKNELFTEIFPVSEKTASHSCDNVHKFIRKIRAFI